MEMMRQNLELASPWTNAPGCLGYASPPTWAWEEPPGVFVTNPISYKARTPAEERGLLPYPGGFLLHTGWPNPGFRRVLKDYARRWAGMQVPVWVHLLAEQPDEIRRMVQALEGREGVQAVELGLPPAATPEEAALLIGAALGELPLVISLPLSMIGEAWLTRLPTLGASAIHISAPRGSLPVANGIKTGRLYGPALLPLVFEALRRLRPLGLPLIAGCGVLRREDGHALLKAGAWAVALDAVLWQIQVPTRD